MMFVPFGIEIPMYFGATANGTLSFVLWMAVESAYDIPTPTRKKNDTTFYEIRSAKQW